MCYLFFTCLFSFAPYLSETYELRPKYFEGKTWSNEETSLMEFSSLTKPMSKSAATYRFSFRVERVSPDGTVDLVVTVEQYRNDAPMERLAGPDFSSLIDRPIALKLRPDGTVTSVVGPEGLSGESRTAFNILEQRFLNGGFGMFLPDKPVRLGDSWEKNEPFMLDMPNGEIDFLMKLHSTLDQIVEYQGKPCLSVSFHGVFQGNIDQGRQASMEGKITGKYLFDPEAGIMVHMESKSDIQGKVHGSEGENPFHLKKEDIVKLLLEEGVH